VTSVALWIVGVIPPTDIEHRVREMQRAAFRRLDLSAGFALPVMIPLTAGTGPREGGPPLRLPSGRLEAMRLIPGACTTHLPWLLWSVRGETGAGHWLTSPVRVPADPSGASPVGVPAGAQAGPAAADTREPFFPRDPGFPLAFSLSLETLEFARVLLGTTPSRPFQPRGIGLYRLRPLREPDGPGATAAEAESGGQETGPAIPDRQAEAPAAEPVGALWERLFRDGLLWEELEARPLRRSVP